MDVTAVDQRGVLAGTLEQRQHNRLRLGHWDGAIFAYADMNIGDHLGKAHENNKYGGCCVKRYSNTLKVK
jgi:hypothetical protein